MKHLKLLTLLAFLLAGCGGRVHLEDETGQRFRAAVAAQTEAKPRKGPSLFTAEAARFALKARRVAGLAKGKVATSASGSLSPSGGGSVGSGEPIRIQAK